MGNAAIGKTIQIENPAPPSVVQELAPVVESAKAFQVLDVTSHGRALECVKALRDGERKITDYFEPARKAADQAKKEILAARDGLIGPFAEARTIYDGKALEYETAEKQRTEEEQRRLEVLARKQEEERQLAEAQAAQDAGDKVLAEQIIREPVTVPVIRVAPSLAQVAGVTTRTIWSAEVVDFPALVRFVAAHPEWTHLLEPCMPNLNRAAVSQHEALAIPGVRAVSTTSRSSRAS